MHVARAAEGGNFLVPNGTFVAELIAFAIIFGVLAKWVLPYVNHGLQARQEMIRQQMSDAEKAAERLAEAEHTYRDALAAGRAQASRLNQEALKHAAALKAEIRDEAAQDASRILAAARTQIESERVMAIATIRSEIGTMAVELAGRIVGESLKDFEQQERVVDRFLDDLETPREQTRAEWTG